MVGSALADAIRSGMGFPLPVSQQLTGWGSGVVTEIQSNGVVSHASGLVTGTCPSGGGALTGGAASGGLISGLSGPSMASRVATAAIYGSVSSELSIYCAQIVSHIMTSGRVAFSSGNITGTCTNTPSNPGTLTGGSGANGTISGLSGTTLASLIVVAMNYNFTSTALVQFCTAICNYIMANASASYSSGAVTGVCPSGGGALSAGIGAGGTIS